MASQQKSLSHGWPREARLAPNTALSVTLQACKPTNLLFFYQKKEKTNLLFGQPIQTCLEIGICHYLHEPSDISFFLRRKGHPGLNWNFCYTVYDTLHIARCWLPTINKCSQSLPIDSKTSLSIFCLSAPNNQTMTILPMLKSQMNFIQADT